MKKHDIEQQDSQFRQKLGALRENLFDRQQDYGTRQAKPSLKKIAPLLIGFVFLAYGVYVFSNGANPAREMSRAPSLKLASSPAADTTAPQDASQGPDEGDAMPPAADAAQVPPRPPALPDRQARPTPPAARQPDAATAAPDSPAEPQSIGNDLFIAQTVACQKVRNRQFVNPRQVFSLAEDNTPMVWMDARAEVLPRMLIHVYYFEGERYCEVRLAVKYPRMRTWSYVTLKSPRHVGRWRVDIIDENGRVLEQVEFETVP